MLPIIDLSYHEPPENIDYDKLASQISGAILRVGYGTGAPGKFEGADPAFETHYYELSKRGVPLGGYHYITEHQPIDEQVALYLETIKGKAFALGHWCNAEIEAGADRLTAKSMIGWMGGVEAVVGECGICTARWCWYDIMGSEYARYASRPLWMMAYVFDYTKYIPHGWSKALLWQHTDKGWFDGCKNAVDENKFMGTEEEYQAWIGGQMSYYPILKQPLKGEFRISQVFGANPSWYPTSQGHNGIDWATPVGTPVYAMQDGVVIRSMDFSQPGITDGKVGYGRHVRIQHAQGVSIYGHFSRRDVVENQAVKAGQQVGLSGGATSDPNSGFSTGAHLHAEYRMDGVKNPVPGGFVYNAIDILKYITAEPIAVETPLYRVKVTVTDLVIRSGPGKAYSAVYKYASGEYDVFEEKWNATDQLLFGRIGAGSWIALKYTERIPSPVEPEPEPEPEPVEPADAEKLAILWDWYKEQTNG